jgi:hypothetical protein
MFLSKQISSANQATIDKVCRFIDNTNNAQEGNKLYFCSDPEIINLLHKDDTEINLLKGLLQSLNIANQYTYCCIPVLPTDSADPFILICIISWKKAIIFCGTEEANKTMVTGSVLRKFKKAYSNTDYPLSHISETYCKVNNIKLTKSVII